MPPAGTGYREVGRLPLRWRASRLDLSGSGVRTPVPLAATRPSLGVAEQFGHRLLVRDRARAAGSDPLPVLPEGRRSRSCLVWVSIGYGLGRVSGHGTQGIACSRRCLRTGPRGGLALIAGRAGELSAD